MNKTKAFKKALAVLLCTVLLFGSAFTTGAVDTETSVVYYVGETAVKTVTDVTAGGEYSIDMYLPDTNPELIAENSYFVGWYTNAQFTGEPVSKITVAEGTNGLYARFKEYKLSFTPSYDDGEEKDTYMYFPATIGEKYVAKVQSYKWYYMGGTELVEDADGDYWRLKANTTGSGSSAPLYFFDEEGFAYQARPNSVYSITLKYRMTGESDENATLRFAIGKSKEHLHDDNNYGFGSWTIDLTPTKAAWIGNSEGFSASEEWTEITTAVTLDSLTSEQLKTNYAVMGFRVYIPTGCSIDVKDVKVEMTGAEYIVNGKTVASDFDLSAEANYKPNFMPADEDIPEGYYFTGWYNNENCEGSPISNDGFTAVSGINKLYAGFKAYETSFEPSCLPTGTKEPQVYLPAVSEGVEEVGTYYANVRAVNYLGTPVEYVEDATNGDYWSITGNGASSVFVFADENQIAYQVIPGVSYKITLDYRMDADTIDGGTTLQVGAGKLKSEFSHARWRNCYYEGDVVKHGDKNSYVKVASAGTVTNTDWETTTLTIDMSNVDLSDSFKIIGLRINKDLAMGEVIHIKNVRVEAQIFDVEYVANGKTLKKETVSVGTAYTPDFMPAAEDIPEGYYFTGWYDNESCEGSPVSVNGITVVSGTNKLYAGFKEYERVFKPYGDVEGLELADSVGRYYLYYPRMMDSTYVPVIVNRRYSGTTTATDENGNKVWRLKLYGASPFFLYDENGVAYQAMPDTNYKVSFEYRYEVPATTTTSIAFGVGVGSAITNFKDDGTLTGNANNYRNQDNFLTINTSAEESTVQSEWVEAEIVLPGLSAADLESYYPIFGFRTSHCNNEGYIDIRNLKVSAVYYDSAEEPFCSFENDSIFTQNSILDETNKYAISVVKAQHTKWQNANAEKEGTNGVYADPKTEEHLYTINNATGFAPENFAIVDGGYQSDRSLRFKQASATENNTTAYKVADISNGVLLKDNTTYNISFYYKAEGESDKDLQFSVLNAITKDYLGYNNKNNSNVVTISKENVASDWTKVTVLFTTDFSYHNPDYAFSEEIFAIPVLCINADIDDTERTVYVDSVSIDVAVAADGASVLTEDAATEAGHQALRVYFSYDADSEGNTVINGESVKVVKRGVLVCPTEKRDILADADGDILRDSINTPEYLIKENAGSYNIINAVKDADLGECWAYEDGVLTYSVYIKGFELEDANDISVRGYIELEDGTVYYSSIKDFNVEQVKGYSELVAANTTYSLTDADVLDKIVLQGNSKVIETGVTSDWNSETIKFSAYCVGDVTVRVHITAASELTYKCLVDGKRITGEFVPKAVDRENSIYEFTFNVGDTPSLKEIQIARLVQVSYGPAEIMSININGTLEDTAESDTLIEFIGDSISSGSFENYGNGTFFADSTRTYAYLTAQRMGVDFRIRSRSGSGIARSAGNATGPGASWDDTYVLDSYVRSTTTPYSHSRNADVVCIYLGTNDNHALSGTENKTETITSDMKALVDIIKGYNPDAKFVWLTGGMTNGFKAAAIQAMSDLGGEEAGYYVCQFPNGLDAGSGGHPDSDQHAYMSEILEQFLIEKGLVG